MPNDNVSTPANNTLAVFKDHVKQVFSTIPPVTNFVLYTPFVILVLDEVLFPLIHSNLSISNWTYLDYEKSVLGFQVYRFLLYPFSNNYLVEVIITSLWLIPEMYKLERRTGTLKFLWLLLTVYTILPGIITVIVRTTLAFALPAVFSNDMPYFYCRGMTGWVVGLIFWSYLQEDPNNTQQDRMIAGAIRIPNKYWPVLVFVFFIFLVPGTSFFMNIICSLIGYLYVKQKIEFLVPQDEKFAEYEGKAWLRFLTNSSNFVSVDLAGGNGYLPIFNHAQPTPASRATNASTPPTSGNFPGQGVRLGS